MKNICMKRGKKKRNEINIVYAINRLNVVLIKYQFTLSWSLYTISAA